MSHLPQILLALLVQTAGESGFLLAVDAPWMLLPLAFLPHALAFVEKHAMLRGWFRFAGPVDLLQRWSGNLAHALLVLGCGWSAAVARFTSSDTAQSGWPTFDLAVLFAPFVLFELSSIDARARLVARGEERAAIRRFQTRMFVSTLLPISVYVGAAAFVGLFDGARVRVEEIAVWRMLFGMALVASLAWLLPTLLRRTWETEPFSEGPQKDLLLSVARLADFGTPRLYVWRTGHTTANAAIVGLTPKSRVVLFSDSLLAQMAPGELAAVFAHEIGHAKRRHVPIFAAWAVALLLGAELAAQAWFHDDELFAGVVLAAGALVWFASFTWMSRRFELDADLFSLDLLGETRSLVSALERVGGRLRDVAGWRHFSVADRVRFLERARNEPDFARRFRRTLRGVAIAGVVLLAVVIGLHAHRAWSTFDEDNVRADLRLGRYTSAVGRAQRAPELAAAFEPLIDRARELHDDAPLGSLLARARAAEERGDLALALQWYELGALRGDVEAATHAARIEASAATSAPVTQERDGDEPPKR